MLLVLVIASAITALAMLRVFANIIDHETELHDLRVRVRELGYEQELYLARLKGDIAEQSPSGPQGNQELDPIQAVEQTQTASEQVLEALDSDRSAPQAA